MQFFCSSFSFPGAWKGVKSLPWIWTLGKLLHNHYFWQFSMNLWEKHRKKLQSGSLGILNLDRCLRLRVTQWRHMWLIYPQNCFFPTCILMCQLQRVSSTTFHKLLTEFPASCRSVTERHVTPHSSYFSGGEVIFTFSLDMITKKMSSNITHFLMWNICL